jgi:CheY-like chemotaxis protein
MQTPNEVLMSRILLVEDNEMNRDMLSRRLTKNGFDIYIAMDGLNGLEMAVSLKPDLILMDMSLPIMDGWEATRRIKGHPALREIPIIALTAHAMGEDRQRALDAGCDDYDTKPIELTRLLQKMAALLAE